MFVTLSNPIAGAGGSAAIGMPKGSAMAEGDVSVTGNGMAGAENGSDNELCDDEFCENKSCCGIAGALSNVAVDATWGWDATMGSVTGCGACAKTGGSG